MGLEIKKFFDTLPENEKHLTNRLREIILKTYPSFTEKFSYGVPYYYLGKRVCFVWPTSVPRSGFKSGVIFGISNGVILKKKFDVISCGTCKVVGWIQYHKLSEIKPKIIQDIIHEAVLFQEMQNLIK